MTFENLLKLKDFNIRKRKKNEEKKSGPWSLSDKSR